MLNGKQGNPCPCNGCAAKRSETCHATCKEFLAWDAEHRANRETALEHRYQEAQADYRKKTAVAKYYRKARRDGLRIK